MEENYHLTEPIKRRGPRSNEDFPKRVICEERVVGGGGREYPYGRRPMPPSSVMVSPLMNLKSGPHSCTTARPISVSTLA